MLSNNLLSQLLDEKKAHSYSLGVTRYGSLSVLAVDIESGNVVVEHHPYQRMTPASLTKVITTGAALCAIDPEFNYQTQFYLHEEDGAKKIIVKGKGDPTLGSNRFKETKPEFVFEQLLLALKDKGIATVDEIIVDNSFFGGVKQPSKRLWEDMGNYYGAVPNGVTYKENTFYLTMKSPDGVGLPVEIVKIEPEFDINVNCLVKTADNNKDSAYVYGYEDASLWYVSGTIPQNRDAFTIKGAVAQPELIFAKELHHYLNENGISVNGYVLDSFNISEGENLLYVHNSPALKRIVKVINKYSHNLWADHLMFQLAYNQCGKADWDNGVRAISDFWRKAIPDYSGQFFDGSGLSPFNAISAHDMVEALRYINVSGRGDAFKQSLAVAGVDGTLRSILKENGFRGKMIGKSGSFNGVLGYCGYITTNKGKTIAFCMIANRFTEPFKMIRTNMEQLMKEIIIQN